LNYTQLKQAIQDYVQSDETRFVANIDNFIQQSEQRLAQAIRTPDTRQFITGFISPLQSLVSIGTINGLVSVQQFSISSDGGVTYTPLLQKEPTWIRSAYPSVSSTGVPQYYALDFTGAGGTGESPQILIGPSANISYLWELLYFTVPTSIITTGTSWYGNNATDALLYNCLVEAYGFLKGEAEMLTFYKGKADEAMMRVQRMAEGLQKYDTYRNEDIRRPIQ
jgi:hypothetical protein